MRFLRKVLQSLDRTYRFEGADKAPSQLEIGLPIQLVHDVSREAALGEAGMGFTISGNDDVHVGAGTVESLSDPYQNLMFYYGGTTNQDILVWLIDCWCTTSASILSSARLSVGYVPWGSLIVRRDRLIRRWAGAEGIYDQNVAPATFPYAGLINNNGVPDTTMPMPIFPGSTMRQQTTVTGAGTVRVEGLFWFGPIGTTPPGTA